tara:strand:+ start:19028 stop:19282 length:255 start_codon:yes stop_codon:yes gene_type:complete
MNTSDNTQQAKEMEPQETKIKPLSLFQTIKSVLWAMLGIQTKENLMRDFAHGKASNFIITALFFVIMFVLTLSLIVRVVLHLAL